MYIRAHTYTGKGPQSASWQQLRSAFQTMETDFKRFDRQGDGLVDYAEITNGIPPMDSQMRLNVLSKLHSAFLLVDADRSGSLNFYEYMYLCFYLTDSGCYNMLVNSQNSAVVKKTFLELKKAYL